jgi:hypothetical protein
VKRVFSICVALWLLLILGLASSAPIAAVETSITVEVINPIAWDLSDYIIKFRTAGFLLGPADHIDIMFPKGTGLTTVTSVYVTVPATVTTYAVIGTNIRILLAAGETIESGVDVTIVVENVTNPAPGSYGLCVGTSSMSPICSDAYDADVVATYELTMAVDPTVGGTATDMSDESPYEAGTIVSITAEANAGYRFVNWMATPEVVFDNANAAETTFTMPDEAVTITANFIAVCQLTICSTAGGEVTTPGEGTFTYDASTVTNLVASPDAGYRFVNWTGNVTNIANVDAASTTIAVNSDYSVIANFVETPADRFAVTTSSTDGGSITTPGEGSFVYDEGTVVNLEAEPDEGYRFVNWSGDVDTIADVSAASTIVTMEGNYQITANFWEGDPCFIATAAYGTPMAEEIQILREFRDEYLLTNPVGQAPTDLYYRVSPPIAEFIKEHPSLKLIVRAGLLPAVAMGTVAVNATSAEKIVILGLLALVSVTLVIFFVRRGRDA